MSPASAQVLRQAGEADAEFLRWACGAVLGWTTPAGLEVPIYQIHGACDRVLPAGRTRADVVVPGAGHLLSFTHASEVNRFLSDRMTGSQPRSGDGE